MGAYAGAHGPRPFAGSGSTRVIRPSELLDQRQAVGYSSTLVRVTMQGDGLTWSQRPHWPVPNSRVPCGVASIFLVAM